MTALFGSAEEAGISGVEKLDLQQNSIINEFLDRLDVESEGLTRVVAIKFESETPRIASRAANTLSEFYIVAQLEAKFEATKRANDWLSERQVAEFSVEYGERHPTMINARAELPDLRAKIKTEVNKISMSLSGRKPARRIIWRARSMILTGSPRRRYEDNKRLEIQQPWGQIKGGASSSRTSTALARGER